MKEQQKMMLKHEFENSLSELVYLIHRMSFHEMELSAAVMADAIRQKDMSFSLHSAKIAIKVVHIINEMRYQGRVSEKPDFIKRRKKDQRNRKINKMIDNAIVHSMLSYEHRFDLRYKKALDISDEKANKVLERESKRRNEIRKVVPWYLRWLIGPAKVKNKKPKPLNRDQINRIVQTMRVDFSEKLIQAVAKWDIKNADKSRVFSNDRLLEKLVEENLARLSEAEKK